MPPARDHRHELERVASKIVSDLETGAKSAADQMIGERGGPGAGKATRADFVQYVRRGATQQGDAGRAFRQGLLHQMIAAVENPYAQDPSGADRLIPARNGVEHVEALLKEAFPLGWPHEPPPPPPEPVQAPMPAPMPAPAPIAPPVEAAPMPAPAPQMPAEATMPAPALAGATPAGPDWAAILSQVPPEAVLNYMAGLQGAPAPQGVIQ